MPAEAAAYCARALALMADAKALSEQARLVEEHSPLGARDMSARPLPPARFRPP
jgi:hypothetical protein